MTRILCAILVAAFCMTAADARRGNDVVHDYYSDAAKTHWIGEVEYTCGGGIIRFGKVSNFVKTSSDSCFSRGLGQNRMSMIPASASKQDRYRLCVQACSRKFGGPHLCDANGCPYKDAENACIATCDANRS